MATDDIDQVRERLHLSLQSVQRDLENLNRKAREVSQPGSGLGMFDAMVGGLSKGLVGTVGLAAGLHQVSKALESVAQSSVSMQMVARNSGMAADSIKDFQLQMRMMGHSSRDADAAIANVNNRLNEFNTYREQSSLAQAAFGREGGAAFLNRLTAAKDRMGQMQEIIDTYKRQGDDRSKRGFADLVGLDVATLDKLVSNSGLLRRAFKASAEDMEKYHAQTVLFEHNVSEAWKSIAGNVIRNINQITDGVDGTTPLFEKATKAINDFSDTIFGGRVVGEGFWESKFNFGGLKQDIKDIQAFAEWMQSLPGNFKDATGIGKEKEKTPEELSTDPMAEHGKGPSWLGIYRGWLNQQDWLGGKPLKAPGGGITDFGGMRRMQSVEEEQNSTLIDIRDILKRMEDEDNDRDANSSGDDTDSTAGGGRGRLARRLGINSRFREGAGRNYPSKLDNGDGSPAQAIGPNTSDTPGAKYLAERRSPFRKELDENPGTRELLGAIISAENPGAGPAVAESLFNRTELVNQDRAKRGLPPLTLRDMIVGHPSIGGGKSFYGPMRSGAINDHLRRMRSDPKHAARMYELQRQALSGSNTILGHTDQGSAGDPNYITGGVGVNINRERFNDWGYRGSRAFREDLMRGYQDAERAAATRNQMDSQQRDIWSGKVAAEVRFTNVPPGVSTNVTTDGDPFERLQVMKSRQNEVAGGSPGQPFAGVW